MDLALLVRIGTILNLIWKEHKVVLTNLEEAQSGSDSSL